MASLDPKVWQITNISAGTLPLDEPVGALAPGEQVKVFLAAYQLQANTALMAAQGAGQATIQEFTSDLVLPAETAVPLDIVGHAPDAGDGMGPQTATVSVGVFDGSGGRKPGLGVKATGTSTAHIHADHETGTDIHIDAYPDNAHLEAGAPDGSTMAMRCGNGAAFASLLGADAYIEVAAPDGTAWRIRVTNAGTLAITPAP